MVLMTERNDKPVPANYPCLKMLESVGHTAIVLFGSERVGMCVWSDDELVTKVGTALRNWDESMFTIYHGEVKLRNS